MNDLLMNHLPVWVVVVPLFGGLLSPFCGKGAGPWIWAVLCMGASLFCSTLLLREVEALGGASLSYALGAWTPQYGIEYRVDALNGYVLFVVSLLAFVSTLYAKLVTETEIPRGKHSLFYAVWQLAVAGLLGITMTGDTFNVYVLLEISSLTVYTLIAMGGLRDRRAYVASLKYLIMGSIGATFILLGIGYILMLTGTLNMADMHLQLATLAEQGSLLENRTFMVAFAFLMVGLAVKMALFPVHTWLPNAYCYAPSAVSALVASTATKVSVYMTFRFMFTIFGPAYALAEDFRIFSILAAAGIIVSSIKAMQQSNVKRVLAYSSIGQLGYIVLGFSLFSQAGITAALVHLFHHALIKGGMFMALGCVMYRVGGCELSDMRGLGKRMPWTMAAFTVGGMSLVGVPLTAGFVSKWYLIRALLEDGNYWLVPVVLIGGLLALIYIWRVIEVIYFHQPDREIEVDEAPLGLLLPTWTLIGLSLFLGVYSEFSTTRALAAARMLLSASGGPSL